MVPQIPPFAVLGDESFVPQCVEMVRQVGRRDFDFLLNLACDKPPRMRPEQHSHDIQPSFVPKCGENSSKVSCISRVNVHIISIILETFLSQLLDQARTERQAASRACPDGGVAGGRFC